MAETLTALSAIAGGASLGMAFNPLLSLLGAAISAALLASGRGARRMFAGASVLLGFWLVGDGFRVMARARDLVDGVGATGWQVWVTVAVWTLVGAGVGYALPAVSGAFAGRRVTWGTGWLTAAAVSIGLSMALISLAAI
jgi:hypothetical protein